MQLKEKRLSKGFRREPAGFDHARCCAPIRRRDGDHSILHDVLARYAIAVDILNADFLAHNDDFPGVKFTGSRLQLHRWLAKNDVAYLRGRPTATASRRDATRLELHGNTTVGVHTGCPDLGND
jgi:hypothetical protein